TVKCVDHFVKRNLRLTSYNMDLVLRWDPAEGAAGSPVYTAWMGCTNTSHLECDFSNPRILVYGTYIGRVRAELGAESSAWVESNKITLDNDSVIGPPGVTLFSSGTTIEVSIKDPVFAISTLREVYNFLTYSITYWKEGEREKQDRMHLSDLEIWTKYCVQVQVNVGRNITYPSRPSSPVCESTRNSEYTSAPWVAALVMFLFMGGAIALVVVAVVYRKTISSFLCPEDALPQHFKEYLLAPPDSSLHLAMRDPQPPQEVFHQVSVVAHDRTVEEGRPLEHAA
uniref:Uncharacterized protein n=1 Tax=Mola mola TaxID=94237 RepID=A0A3Q3XM82_MOLML